MWEESGYKLAYYYHCYAYSLVLSQSNLYEVVNTDEVAVLVVAELPRVTMCYESVGNVQDLGKINHPCTDMDVIADDEQRTTNDLDSKQQHARF